MKVLLFTSGLTLALTVLVSCKIRSDHLVETRHEIKPIEINVNVRVEKELDRFFQDLDEASSTVIPPETTSTPETTTPPAP
jgi:uncharacterized glyoxalase superfamily protein PhnB